MVQTGYAKDGVPIIDYPVNPSTFGSTSPSGIYSSINGGNVGTITKGWLPGDPVACCAKPQVRGHCYLSAALVQ